MTKEHYENKPTPLGSMYQARIPKLLKGVRHSKVSPQCVLKWSPTGIPAKQIEQYLESVCGFGENELGLHCLNDSGYDFEAAKKLLRQCQRQKARMSSKTIDTRAFKKAIYKYGKDFYKIKKYLGNSCTTGQAIDFYYKWKSSDSYNDWKNYDLKRRIAEEGESDNSEFHNDFCGKCGYGGDLLCCDACESAFHLYCLIPKLAKVPDGEWFCKKCKDFMQIADDPMQKSYLGGPSFSSASSGNEENMHQTISHKDSLLNCQATSNYNSSYNNSNKNSRLENGRKHTIGSLFQSREGTKPIRQSTFDAKDLNHNLIRKASSSESNTQWFSNSETKKLKVNLEPRTSHIINLDDDDDEFYSATPRSATFNNNPYSSLIRTYSPLQELSASKRKFKETNMYIPS